MCWRLCPTQPALCLSSRCPSFPGPFPHSVLGQGTSAGQQLCSSSPSPGRQPCACPVLAAASPGSWSTHPQTLQVGQGRECQNSDIHLKEKRVQAHVLLWALLSLALQSQVGSCWSWRGAAAPTLQSGERLQKANHCCCSLAPAWPCRRAPGRVAGGLPRAARLPQASWGECKLRAPRFCSWKGGARALSLAWSTGSRLVGDARLEWKSHPQQG